MKKKLIIILTPVLIISMLLVLLNSREKPFIVYLPKPFIIPGKQMAATIPPLGIFIEKADAKREKIENNNLEYFSGCLLAHELAHWDQYKTLGLLPFYKEYLSAFTKEGRKHNKYELDARNKAKTDYELLRGKYLK